MIYGGFEIQSFEAGRGLWHARIQRTDLEPVVIVGQAGVTDGAADHIETLAHKYLGGLYPWYGGKDQIRSTVAISIDKLHAMGQ